MVDTLCAGCERLVAVDDLGLCQECSAKLDRDLIRARDWAYSVTAALTQETERETLRLNVIARYGAAYELIQPPTQAERRARKPKRLIQTVEPRAAGTYTESDVLDSLERLLAAGASGMKSRACFARNIRPSTLKLWASKVYDA
jgi:hypothetical protein